MCCYYHVGGISLGLNRRSSLDSTMSHDDELEEDLFDLNTTAMRTGAWCLLDALTSCLTNNDASSTNSSSLVISLSPKPYPIDRIGLRLH